ncbi:hypothetical protein L462_03895 [Enterobacter sp. BIDMC 26]|nr:hypothetical protein L462_03895 [Enterobacter sp. BIDMC 26]
MPKVTIFRIFQCSKPLGIPSVWESIPRLSDMQQKKIGTLFKPLLR